MKQNNKENRNERRVNRVVYAWNYLTWGGAQVYFLGLIKKAKEHFEIDALLPVGSDPQIVKFFEEEGVKCTFFSPAFVPPTGSGLFNKIRLHIAKIKSERAMLTALDRNFDLERSIVHIELAPWQSLFSLVWLLLRTRVFITMHNSLAEVNPIRKVLWKLKLRIVSNFRNFYPFSSNEDSKLFFEGYFSDETYRKIVVTYTNVDPDEIEEAFTAKINRKELRKANGLREDSFLVLGLGQFIDRKGRWTFLDAAKKIAAANPNIEFAWVSNSSLSPEDSRRIDEYGLKEQFHLLESDSVAPKHIELFKFVRSADLYVLPSFQEGLPISLLEAMALQIPCISTRVNAIPEAIIHDVNGCLIEAGDADGLAETILRLFADDELRMKLGKEGRKTVLEKFNEKEVAKIAVERYLAVSESSE